MKRTRVTERFSAVVKAPQGRHTRPCSRGQRRADGIGDAGRRASGGAAGSRSKGSARSRKSSLPRAIARSGCRRSRSRSPRSTPIEIEMRAFTVASDVAYTVPNASFRPAQAAFGNTMTAFIRGIGQYDFDFAVRARCRDLRRRHVPPVHAGFADRAAWTSTTSRCCADRRARCSGAARSAAPSATSARSRRATTSGSIGLTLGDFDRVDLRASYDFAITDNVFARVTGVSTTPGRLPGRPRLHLRAPGAVRRPADAARQPGRPAARSARRAGPTTSAAAACCAGTRATTSRSC